MKRKTGALSVRNVFHHSINMSHVKQQRTYLFTNPKLIKIDLNQCVRQQSHILSIQIGKFHEGAYLKDLKKLTETKEISKKMWPFEYHNL